MGRPKKVIPVEETPKKTTKKTTPKNLPPLSVPKATKTGRDKITRAQAIKLFCIECMGFQKSLVKDCTDQQCPLWPYRRGFGQEHTDFGIRK
jgi:hypothetical protein